MSPEPQDLRAATVLLRMDSWMRGGRAPREIVWTDASCAGCGRPAYERRDGRTYLYSYDNSAPVCRPACVPTNSETGAL